MQEVILTMTLDEANMVLTAIQELPARVANPLTDKLRKQAEQQLSSNKEATTVE